MAITVPAAAQTAGTKPAAKPAAKSAIPRTPWGKPDLQGVWDRHTITPLQRPEGNESKVALSDEEVAEAEAQNAERTDADKNRKIGTEADVSRAYNQFWWDRPTKGTGNRSSLIVDPQSGRLPELTAQAKEREKQEANQPAYRSLGSGGRGNSYWGDRSLWERCLTQGSTRLGAAAYNANFLVVQSEDSIVIMHEQIHEARVIPIGSKPHLPSSVRQWMGDSRAKWEGDTLVVDNIHFNNETWFDKAGNYHSEQLHVIERYTPAGPDHIQYEVTVEDPKVFSRPWKMSMIMYRRKEPNMQVLEYECYGFDAEFHAPVPPGQ